MTIIDEKLLDEYRTPGPCELCHLWSVKRDPHHAIPKGHGGANRLDHRLNLVAVGQWKCSESLGSEKAA